jgi:hypothetical protein
MIENIGTEEYEFIENNCDLNGDGKISDCEMFECYLERENDWRAINCESAENLYCKCPWNDIPDYECDPFWNCAVAEDHVAGVFAKYDKNTDMLLNLADLEYDDYERLRENCDANGNLSIDACEF